MGKIEKINKSQSIDYSNCRIDYFICENDTSGLKNIQFIIDKIKNAKDIVRIASVSNISDEILDALHQNTDLNIYMSLKSFDRARRTLDRFDSRRPAIIREIAELDNNFILIDNKSYLFVNSLVQKENITIELDEKQTKDLGFIFNYYFWNCASKEKLVDTTGEPVESPFPPFEKREHDYINIVDSELENCDKLYIPRDRKFINQLDMKSSYKYFSADIHIPVCMKENIIQIGKFRVNNAKLIIQNSWMLKNDLLKDINIASDIIPMLEAWDNGINILEFKKILLPDMRALSIEDMQNSKPEEFPKEKYIKKIDYFWNVLPPIRSKEAIKSSLYNEYYRLAEKFNDLLDSLENNLKNVMQESSSLSIFMGTTRKSAQNLKKIEEYRSIDLKSLNSIDLKDLIENEFKFFYIDIKKSENSFIEDKKREESKNKWAKEKEFKIKVLDKKKNELKVLNEELSLKHTHVQESQKNNSQNEEAKFSKTINDLKNEIERLERELEDRYAKFEYKANVSELSNLKKSNDHKYPSIELPKYSLPEVGLLYETNQIYFLEITDLQDLEKANELKLRYLNKEEYKVVAGEYNE